MILWQPGPERVAHSNLTRFTHFFESRTGRTFDDIASLHEYSVREIWRFWAAMWQFAGVIGDPGGRAVVDADRMPGARFFPDARLNFAEQLLQGPDDAPALLAATESDGVRMWTFGDLRRD